MMDGIKVVGVGGGGGGVGVGEADMGDGMQCSDHPYRNNTGGICAFCLQEKLGKLVSSSFPLPIRRSSSSSSSPSFRSDIGTVGAAAGSSAEAGTSMSLAVRPTFTKVRNDGGKNNHYHHQECYTRRAKIPFLVGQKKKIMVASSSDRDAVFKRSKSTRTPGRRFFLDSATDNGEDFSPRKRGGFWSFLYHSSSKTSTSRNAEKMLPLTGISTGTAATTNDGSLSRPKETCLGSSLAKRGDIVAVEDDDSPNSQATASASSFERKVSRSRSIGCGSRSFSGDFFERISTGFGDCTLRRVESQREGKPKVAAASTNLKERVKCGGIFGGFIITSASSYWVSSAEDMNGKSTAAPIAHGRNRS